MSTRIPVTLEGNIATAPESGRSDNGLDYTRFNIAVNDRKLNVESGQWEDAGVVFHRVVTFGPTAQHVAASLQRGDAAIVVGEMKFGSYTNPDTGQVQDTRDIVADAVGPSLRFTQVTVDRGPKANGPAVHATGPVVTVPAATSSGAGLA